MIPIKLYHHQFFIGFLKKNGLFLVVKKPLLYFLISLLKIGSLFDNIFFALNQKNGGLLIVA